MRAEIDTEDLESLIEKTANMTVQQLAGAGLLGSDQVALTEARAAAALDVPRHVLRNARLRGEISARRIGRRYVYAVENLRKFVSGNDH